MGIVMHNFVAPLAFARGRLSLSRFRDDERGAMAFFILFVFIIMIMFGGIAVDVMRYETRRVAMQQTMDRAALAAASLTQTMTPKAAADEWFKIAGLGKDSIMVDYTPPTVQTVFDAGLRRVTITSKVRSYNFFMHLVNQEYLEGPTNTQAAQGVSQIEVMLVLDITGSMNDPAVAGDPKTKIAALREAAQSFITIVKGNDKKNGVSIGMVPYAAQVNLPLNLRQQFSVQNVSSWNGVANAGVPNINCIEVPTSTYTATALSRVVPMRMHAVADAANPTTTTTNFIAASLGAAVPGSRACTTLADVAGTPYNEELLNQLMLPTKDGEAVKTRVSRLVAGGNTAIAVGMRWGTAMLDETARPIYTAIGDKTTLGSVQGRPADNTSIQTRKIIILMTDGEHVTNSFILDNFKTGMSPIWRGTDGNFAIRYATGGSALTGGARPATCSGWTILPTREYFVPHLKADAVKQKKVATELEGKGSGVNTTGACDPLAWYAAPTWPVLDNLRNPVLDSKGKPVVITATQLDWSEVWRYLRVSWVARQLYMRSGVVGTTDYNTIMNQFRGAAYLTSASNMDSLLQLNCTAGRTAGIEIYGIAFAAPANGQTQISDCASSPKENYYYNATDSDKLLSAFRQIATDISELRLTQ